MSSLTGSPKGGTGSPTVGSAMDEHAELLSKPWGASSLVAGVDDWIADRVSESPEHWVGTSLADK